MKKKRLCFYVARHRREKILLGMKLSIAFLIFFSFNLSGKVNAQYGKVNLDLKDVSIKLLFNEIQKQTNTFFVFSSEQTRELGKFTIKAENEDLEHVLERIFKGTGFKPEFDGDLIIIRKEERPQTPSANELRITGVVTDVKGNPLPGVTVRLKSLNLAVATDKDGRFVLSMPESSNIVLIFSFVGMKEKEVVYKGEEELRVVLEESKEELDEVIVTGYANVRKSSFTGSVTQVTGEEIRKISSGNLIDALQVFDPSLRVMKNNEMGSDPNTLPEFYIRGRSSFDAVKELDLVTTEDVSQFSLVNNPNLPIFILDGFEVSVEKIYDYDLNRIKDISILKDAAATAIYGSRASNGVIVIETHSPQPGEFRVTYAGNYIITAPDLSSYNLMNSREKLDAEVAADLFEPWRLSSGGTHSPEAERRELHRYYQRKLNNILIGVDNYWLSQPLETMFNHKHSVSIEGGAEHLRFAVELNYDKQNGVMKESDRTRTGAGLALDYRFKGFQLRNKIEYQVVQTKDSPYGSFSDYANKHPYDRWEDDDGNLVKELQQWGNGLTIPKNPLYEATLNSFSKGKYRELINNLTLNWYVNDYLLVKSQFAISRKDDSSEKFTDPESLEYGRVDLFLKGDLTQSETTTNRWNLNAFAAYNRLLGDTHYLNLSLGINATSTDYGYTTAHYRGFPDSERHSPAYAYEIVKKPSFSDNKTRLFGGFITANYSYNDIYLFDGSLRLDGSSEFGSEKKWAPFWSLGTGLNLHNYAFLRSSSWVNMLRIVGNVGITGKTNFQPYMARNTFEVLLDEWYPTGIGADLIYLGNENLTWERETAWNLRSELTMFKNRYSVKFELFHKKTKDLITTVSLPTSSGFKEYTDNIGEILNKGFEINVNLRVYTSRDWDVVVFGNIAHNKNEILKIAESLKQYNERIDDYFEDYGMDGNLFLQGIFSTTDRNSKYSKPFMKYEEGSSLDAIYGMKSLGINPANGQEVYLKRDGTITYDWSSAEQQKIGDKEPWGKGAFGFNVRYKGFTLYTTFLYEFGGDLYNQTLVNNVENANIQYYNADRRVLTDRWQEVGDVTPLKAIQDRYRVTRSTSRFVQKNNTLTFNSLTLGYDFEKALLKKIGISKLNLQFNMKDIAHISTIKREMGLNYPFARTFSLSLNTSF